MDEVIIKGIKYISSKRAAKETGYTKDYIGQLVRLGKLKATKVGRAWFIDEREVAKFMPALPVAAGTAAMSSQSTVYQSTVIANVSFPKSWNDIKYFEDSDPLLPISLKRDTLENKTLISAGSVSTPDSDLGFQINLSRKAGSQNVMTAVLPEAVSRSVSFSSVDGVRVSFRDVGKSAGSTGEPEQARFHAEPVFELIEDSQSKPVRFASVVNFLRIFVSAVVVSIIALLMPIVS
jgi:excisionase family DNA binding protein